MCGILAIMLRLIRKRFFCSTLTVLKGRRTRIRHNNMIGLTSGTKMPRGYCSTTNNNRNNHVTSPAKPSISPKVVILEGNIGVGKTTLACQLARKLNYRLFLEPTTKNPYLAKFYDDPKKYALKLQLWIFRQRFKMYAKAALHLLETGQGVLLDRSVFSDCVFANVNYQEGTISEEGYKYYNELKAKALKALPIPHVMLYVDASPSTCFERIHGRGRDYESGIPLAYLQSLDTAYKSMLTEMRKLRTQVFVYDWSDFGYQYEVCKDIKNAACIQWNQSLLEDFNAVISDSAILNQTLTLSYTIPDTEFKDEIAEECDVIQEEEKRSHILERANTTAQQKLKLHHEIITLSDN